MISSIHILDYKSYIMYFVLKTLFQALYLEIKPLKFTLGLQGENSKIAITQKALQRNFLISGFT
jgi:hypothetical protein